MGIINIAQAGVISDAPSLSSAGINFLNFLLSVFGIIAIIMLVVSGIIYFFSAGNEELNKKAKRATTYAIVGIILASSGMIIVRTMNLLVK